MTDTVILTFRGHFPPGSFGEFARHRAARLSLSLDLIDQTVSLSRMRVTGPAPMLDAFEMALSLGPHDCLVRDVARGNA